MKSHSGPIIFSLFFIATETTSPATETTSISSSTAKCEVTDGMDDEILIPDRQISIETQDIPVGSIR